MTRTHPLFTSPRLIGFDALSDLIDSMSVQTQKTFPPFNLMRIGADRYRIELAVAGFAEEDLAIEREGDKLRVSATPKPVESEGEYFHRGIALRAFKREFHLAPYIQVTGATITNGLLSIDLARETPEAMRPQTIPIGAKAATTAPEADGGETA